MLNLLQQLTQRVLSNDSRIIDREIELWANLYSLTRQQQHFAHAMLPSLQQLNSPLLTEAQQIIELDTILRCTKGILLKKADRIRDPDIKQHVLDLLNQ